MTAEPVTRVEIYYAIEDVFATPPVRAADILAAARTRGLREEVLDALGTLPADQPFQRLRDLWQYYPDMPTGAYRA